MRFSRTIWAALLSLACGAESKQVSVSGDVMPFENTPSGRIAGAKVCILERAERCVVTGADGAFRFDGLPSGSAVTLTMEHRDYPRVQTATHTLSEAGMTRLTFQVPAPETLDLLAATVNTRIDPTRCQIASTVTRAGKSIYDEGAHGEAGATVRSEPLIPSPLGPVYFNARVIPQTDLTQTSEDGGVLYANVPPGTYVLSATKPNTPIRSITIRCRAGWLVNASPPWGLQAL